MPRSRRWTRQPPVGTPIDPQHPQARGLVGFWPLNEPGGTTAFDASPYKRDAVYTSAQVDVSEKGRSFRGDGSAGLVDTNHTFTSATRGTISIWFNLDAYNGSTDFALVANYKGSGFGAGEFLFYLNNDQDLEVFLGTDGFVETDLTTVGVWVHAAVTFEPNDIRLYVDGQQRATDASFASSVFGFTHDVRFGADHDGTATPNPNRNFDGLLADARIYNRALAPVEVRDHLYTNPYDIYQPRRASVFVEAEVVGQAPSRYPWNMTTGYGS